MAGVFVYVDGFNLYHGARAMAADDGSGTPWKWLDLIALAQRLAPGDNIIWVRYFTARVKAPNHDPQLAQRQQTYLRALGTFPNVEAHFGQFKRQKKHAALVARLTNKQRRIIRSGGLDVHSLRDGGSSVEVWRTEEKGSDVNLATYLLLDAFAQSFDRAIVISNDTDLCEPIRVVTQIYRRAVTVVQPRGHQKVHRELKTVATDVRTLRLAVLGQCQLPPALTDPRGTITKPAGW